MMAPQVVFYILQESNQAAREQFACRLVEKAYQQKNKIYIHTVTQIDANKIDEYLWTHNDISFLPHNLIDENQNPPPPIQIGCSDNPPKRHDLLINLTQSVPHFYNNYPRIFEIVLNDETEKTAARERYKLYQERRCQLTSHKL